ncbi:hypothetical protein PA598K_03992 [Paenibacillus sp. 598K]|uniref:hypothetical protein n=1 Tax=Paenibacillus sp. 598K TaxID=1117987 RepID=UPI000FFAF40F|nr:hypothetical protein [Paenibacillus sp. 598K]GBF75574.1 hypothetical protein PA598K_03992 [Paenibacillus sp. 598K]
MRLKMTLAGLAVLLALAGCGTEPPGQSGRSGQPSGQSVQTTIGNPTAEAMLERNPQTDLLQYQGIVYVNAKGIDWVQEQALEAGERVGEIKRQSSELPYADLTATRLPEGTELFKPKEKSDILIAVVGEEQIRYLAMIEG